MLPYQSLLKIGYVGVKDVDLRRTVVGRVRIGLSGSLCFFDCHELRFLFGGDELRWAVGVKVCHVDFLSYYKQTIEVQIIDRSEDNDLTIIWLGTRIRANHQTKNG